MAKRTTWKAAMGANIRQLPKKKEKKLRCYLNYMLSRINVV